MNQFVQGEATILGVTTAKVGFRQLDNLALNGSETDALLLHINPALIELAFCLLHKQYMDAENT
jgi:hypothetical protein